jgi:hypothetical protein
VLPDNTIDLSEELLNEMHKAWFEWTREQFASTFLKLAPPRITKIEPLGVLVLVISFLYRNTYCDAEKLYLCPYYLHYCIFVV